MSVGNLGLGLDDEGPIRVDPVRPQRRSVRRAVAGDHAAHGVAVNMQLPRDGPHTPLLHRVQAQDLRNHVRGYGHRAVRLAAQRASDGAGSLAERRHSTGRRSAGSARARCRPALVRARWCRSPPGCWRRRQRCSRPMRCCRGSMRAVKHRYGRHGNPGASHSVRARRGARASAGCARRAQVGRGTSADSGRRLRAGPHRAPGANTRGRSSGCRGRSDCTAAPARGSPRTGTNAPRSPRRPRPGRGAGRTRPSAPHSRGTAFIGTV